MPINDDRNRITGIVDKQFVAAQVRLPLSNRSQPRPPFRAQLRPLGGVIELLGMAFTGAGRAVDKWPAGATVQSQA
jgi:hypothetical protein